MIVERAARCRLIAQQLRAVATRLDSEVHPDRATAHKNDAVELRAVAEQVEKL
jgi:hypothetical protein